MYYLHTMVRITNIATALDFYCTKLGLTEVSRYESAEGRFTNIFLAAAGDSVTVDERRAPLLELTFNWPNEDGTTETYTGGRNFGHLAFAVENIYETCAKLRADGITINRPPRDGRMAFIKSPDGISIELLQIGDALPPEEPWQLMDNTGTW
jgi:lactoylglutathione lyase